MKRFRRHWWLGAFVLIASSARAATLNDTLARMDQAAAHFTSLSADLRRVAHTDVINEDMVDMGTIQMKRSKGHDVRMFLDIQKPDPKQVLIDTKRVELYYPDSLLEQIYDLTGKYKSLVDQFLLLGFGSTSAELESSYTISLGGTEVINGERATRLQLTPKSPEVLTHLKRVDLWLSDQTGLPLQQKFYEPSGDYQLATYTNIKINPNLPELKLDLPRGVKKEYPLK